MSFLSEPVQFITTGQNRTIGSISVNVVISESTTDTLTITKQPVQQGASITDHAYKEPVTFGSTIYFRDNLSQSLSKIYQNLLDLQISRVPFMIRTPKRIYKNMLLAVLTQTTDKNTENTLAITSSFQEVILVDVSTVNVPRTSQKNPGNTGATQNAGKKSSFLYTGVNAVTGLFQ